MYIGNHNIPQFRTFKTIMKNILIIHAHNPSDFSKGELNTHMTTLIEQWFNQQGHDVEITHSAQNYDVAEELEKHQKADLVVLQTPVNWMGVPWSYKKYMDEVYTAGMGGALCLGDGRSGSEDNHMYGSSGTLKKTHYMLSLTFNAPEVAFENKDAFLFTGKSVDDLFYPMHMNFKFFGMNALPTFACFDVLKNPQIKADEARLIAHLNQHVLPKLKGE